MMKSFSRSLRYLGTFFFASLLTLAVFGVFLSLFSTIPAWQGASTKLAFSLFSAGLAFAFGGMLSALLNQEAWLVQSLTLGVLFSGFSFLYLFGVTWNALLGTILAALLAAAGGWLAAGMQAAI